MSFSNRKGQLPYPAGEKNFEVAPSFGAPFKNFLSLPLSPFPSKTKRYIHHPWCASHHIFWELILPVVFIYLFFFVFLTTKNNWVLLYKNCFLHYVKAIKLSKSWRILKILLFAVGSWYITSARNIWDGFKNSQKKIIFFLKTKSDFRARKSQFVSPKPLFFFFVKCILFLPVD